MKYKALYAVLGFNTLTGQKQNGRNFAEGSLIALSMMAIISFRLILHAILFLGGRLTINRQCFGQALGVDTVE